MTETKTKTSKAAKPASPAKNEVDAEDPDATPTLKITVTVKGTEVELELPATFEDADPDAIVALEEEKLSVAFKALIGPRYWAQLRSLGWTAKDFRSVVSEWTELAGAGNE